MSDITKLSNGTLIDALIGATDMRSIFAVLDLKAELLRRLSLNDELVQALEWSSRSEHHAACAKWKGHLCNCHVGAAKAALSKAQQE